MIVKILPPSAKFNGVRYNTNKIDNNKGELMAVANFGPLQGLGHLLPQDYINYLKFVSGQNTRIKKPQFHTVISAKGKTYTKEELTKIGHDFIAKMGYTTQPYLIVFHKDTANNHIHLVSTRIDKTGKKIDSAFEKVRAVKAINDVLGYTTALTYNISTKAQFYLVIESLGFLGKDFNEQKLEEKIQKHIPDPVRILAVKNLLQAHKDMVNFQEILRNDYQIDLVFHAAEGKKPYGYTIIDHQNKQVFKGSEVFPLRELLKNNLVFNPAQANETSPPIENTVHVPSIWIADDIDDEGVLGRNRRRKKKARTNTR